MAFKESLRLIPPVPSIPRCAMRDRIQGFRLPAGTRVGVNPLYTHRMPDVWPEPEKFDPMRFTDEASRSRHKFAFGPTVAARICAWACISLTCKPSASPSIYCRARKSRRADDKPDWQYRPIPKPRDGLRVKLTPIA